MFRSTPNMCSAWTLEGPEKISGPWRKNSRFFSAFTWKTSRAGNPGAGCGQNFDPAARIQAGHGADASTAVGSKPKDWAAWVVRDSRYQRILSGAGVHPRTRDGAWDLCDVSGSNGNARGVPNRCGHVADADRTTEIRGHHKREVIAVGAIDNLGVAQGRHKEQRGYRNEKDRNARTECTSNIHDLLQLIDSTSASQQWSHAGRRRRHHCPPGEFEGGRWNTCGGKVMCRSGPWGSTSSCTSLPWGYSNYRVDLSRECRCDMFAPPRGEFDSIHS
jgi:hypothetical protein